MILFYTGLIGEYHLLNLRPGGQSLYDSVLHRIGEYHLLNLIPGGQSLYDSVLHRIDWRIPSIEPETRRK